MCRTNNAALNHKLEGNVPQVAYDQVHPNAALFDLMFLLRISHQPLKYTEIARTLLFKAKQFKARTIMFVCNLYTEEPFIKDVCHLERGVGAGGRNFAMISHGQKRPSDISATLKSIKFVNAFFSFLKDEWGSERCSDL